jgi:RNA polymerase sigma factor (sigma-70 family)
VSAVVRDAAIIEDLTQETFAGWLSAVKRGVVIEDHRAFLFGVANRLLLAHMRSKGKQRKAWWQLTYMHKVEADAEEAGVKEDVRLMLGKLDAFQHAIVAGRHLLGLSMQELAVELHTPLTTIYREYGRGMERLREIASSRGFAL